MTLSGFLPVYSLLAPLAVFVLLTFLGRPLRAWGDKLAIAALATSFVAALMAAIPVLRTGVALAGPSFQWLAFEAAPGAAPFTLSMGVFLDAMGAIMLLVVTGLATLVLVFSTWYLHDDRLYTRFFSHFSFFCFAMIGVVISDNLLMSFVFWELVGVGSYLLIGFWYDKPAVADDAFYQQMKPFSARGILENKLSPSHAQLKAFVMNRVGDFGFLAGIALFAWAVLSANPAVEGNPLAWGNLFQFAKFPDGGFAGLSSHGLLTLAGICVFLGAMGKSAQFPLHTWLPDAMQGPTTASAIIHAATMVAAGVFLTARIHPLLTPEALVFVTWIGAITCFVAATIACVQWDIKAVLAYSTVSQLGYMMVGLGSGVLTGGYAAGVGHLFTHAMFKCLLFLGAASVIHAAGGHQDLSRMGGLGKKMPWTAAAMGIATLAILGVPGFSAFWSKDAILAAAMVAAEGRAHGASAFGALLAWLPWVLALLTAGLTCYYMTRQWVLAFLGKPRDHEIHHHAHDPWPRSIAVLVILSVFCLQFLWTGTLNPVAAGSWLDKPVLASAQTANAIAAVGGPAAASKAAPPGHGPEATAPPHEEASFAVLPEAHTTMVASHTDEVILHHAHLTTVGATLALLVLGLGAAFALFFYAPRKLNSDLANRLRRTFPISWLWAFLANLWFIDRLWDALFVEGFGKRVTRFTAALDLGTRRRLDGLEGAKVRGFVLPSLDGLIDGSARAIALVGRTGNLLQNGRAGAYAGYSALAAGLVVVVLLLF